ncbi:MAG: hypothetical protein U5R31_06260 [Acidimicrobiia bacterium]|nr:hypothetical protein [Acidimicrobiia bacterium]
MMGLGLGTAILLDGLVVRLIVVPSFLQLVGGAAWWFPKWLDRILPRVAIEGRGTDAAADTGEPGATSTVGADD